MPLEIYPPTCYIDRMRPFVVPVIALFLLPVPAMADDPPGFSLMERGAQMFLEGILKEMEPAIEEFGGLADEMGPALRGFAEQMGPKLAEILAQVEDWTAYQAPEILPNGDIIIRRKPDHPRKPENTPSPQIEL